MFTVARHSVFPCKPIASLPVRCSFPFKPNNSTGIPSQSSSSFLAAPVFIDAHQSNHLKETSPPSRLPRVYWFLCQLAQLTIYICCCLSLAYICTNTVCSTHSLTHRGWSFSACGLTFIARPTSATLHQTPDARFSLQFWASEQKREREKEVLLGRNYIDPTNCTAFYMLKLSPFRLWSATYSH